MKNKSEAQKFTGIVPPAYNKFGVTYAEVIDWFSTRGYDILFRHTFAVPQKWTALVCYKLTNNVRCGVQIKDDNEDFFYSDDWQEVADKVISLSISLMEEINAKGWDVKLPE